MITRGNNADLVIYTCLTGTKEALGNPIESVSSAYSDLNIRFICFTDSASSNSDVWEIVTFDSLGLSPVIKHHACLKPCHISS
jgi:hypothetical protein